MLTPLKLAPLAALLFAATTARAQDYDAGRTGAGATLAISPSSAGINCTPRCGGDRVSGPTYTFRGTEAVTTQFSLAVEADAFQQNVQTISGPGNWRMTWVMVAALWYPREDQDVYIEFGFGGAYVQANATFPTVGAIDLSSTNVGYVMGIGRDFRLTPHVGLTAHLDYLTTPRSVTYLSGTQQNARMGADIINIGLGLSVF